MQVDTYSTRNFATLGHSGLMPPFARTYIQSFHLFISFYRTGQASDLIHHLTILQSPVFLLNSRRSQLSMTRTIIAYLYIFTFYCSYISRLTSKSHIATRFRFVFCVLIKAHNVIRVSSK